ncbi:hemolysin type calcium-binding protein [Nocardioides albertanoniae]|uniref:Hemolysin type calcium-binding protein n=1 Tax=Nocardioides albertanoniae TaxID=1175486 RepID=A0A543A2B4_9ACTN|nr:calcium-binding protein [Nocardioides albertanoniae]TQL66718.1 hemolysin type calcium-binding protein [Nocardioides albertanoniae]
MVLLTGRTLLAGIVALAASATMLAASPASAATTSTGVRCTIVGTSGGDVLKGTSRRDVICGRGGSDIIYARGGDDLIDAGSGGDHVYAGYGADKVLAGSGEDRIHGGGGTDSLYGGTGQDHIWGEDGGDVISGGDHLDVISGGAGADRIYGGAAGDTIYGGTGADAVSGGTGADSVSGGDGNDKLAGGDGNDRLSGGYGDDRLHGNDNRDTISGGPGQDLLWGESSNDILNGDSGNDKLAGGSGVDEVHGNGGTNTCYYDVYDYLYGCFRDTKAPVIVSASLSPTAVDSDSGDTLVRVRVHVKDDLRVSRVQGWVTGLADDNPAQLYTSFMPMVSGGIRDGWWQGYVTVPRWTPGGKLSLQAIASDTAGRETEKVAASMQVTSTNPDEAPPVVRLKSLSATSVDVRTGAKTIKAVLTVTDRIGVTEMNGLDSLSVCFGRTMHGDFICGADPVRTAGTIYAGEWTVSLTVPKGTPTGAYDLQVYAADRISVTEDYYGPHLYQEWVDTYPSSVRPEQELPGATFKVTGS